MPTDRPQTPGARYGCHEAREDADLVVGQRATAVVDELFHRHLRECVNCRKMARSIELIYQSPPNLRDPVAAQGDQAFADIIRRMRTDATLPWHHRWSAGVAIAGLMTAAVVLLLSLFDVAPEVLSLPLTDATYPYGPVAGQVHPGYLTNERTNTGGIDHPAQTYGRILGGVATLNLPGGQSPTTDTFGVGTRFEVSPNDSFQIGLIGKMVANFTPGSLINWTTASASLIELEVEKGMVAVRYDRRPSDPVLQIRTPSAVVRVIGTVFTVQVDAANDTTVSVLRGQVEVLEASSNRVLAEVESGYRFDIKRSTFHDVGRFEVTAALPLSNDGWEPGAVHDDEPQALVAGGIPLSWNVPGLPSDPQYRTLDYVPTQTPEPQEVLVLRRPTLAAERSKVTEVAAAAHPHVEDEGESLIARLVKDVEATRRKEVRSALDTCRRLYEAHDTRYLAVRCLADFLDKYGHDEQAVEGYLLVGMLRMDYALDYQAAEVAFLTFLRRAPNHPSAEFALYRLWLASTENGRISEAVNRGRTYLGRYPTGKYVGKILQRFPELKSAL